MPSRPARRVAVYAGSFDPITYGHVDLVDRARHLFDEVRIAVGRNPNKRNYLSLDARVEAIRASLAGMDHVVVDTFEGLLVDYCRRVGAHAILRGLRAVTDFEFEFQIGLANMDMAPNIQTVFLLTDPANIFISSSLVREILLNGGDVSRYVPAPALAALRARMAEG